MPIRTNNLDVEVEQLKCQLEKIIWMQKPTGKCKKKSAYLPVKIAVELWLGSRGQIPVPENSCFNRKTPSSMSNGCIVVAWTF